MLRAPRAFAAPQPPEVIEPENPGDPQALATAGSRRALVVGGGLAGLSAALELAERGYRVELRESGRQLGGRLSTVDTSTPAGDFRVEHGLHMWFDNYHVFRDIRARLDIDRHFRPYDKIHFVYRDYQPEVVYSDPPIYPLNLVALLQRSPNLSLASAPAQLGLLFDVLLYDHQYVYQSLDGKTFPTWIQERGIPRDFYELFLQPAASVTLNDPLAISAAEMALYMHYYFTGQPRAMNREVTTVDHATAVIDPWAARLRQLGVDLRLNAPVSGLRLSGDRVVGTVDSAESYDWVVVASHVPGTQRLLAGSRATDEPGQRLLDALRGRISGLRVAPPYKVLRLWFDRPLDPSRPDVLETPQHPPINLLAQFHLLEEESRRWAERTGGSIIEFHLYANPQLAPLEDGEVWPRIRPVALELLPELADARVLAYTVGSHHDFSSFEVGQGLNRPTATAARDAGVRNLALAGDWVHTTYPTALMERAVATGREAANMILLGDSVRQVPITATSGKGPGLI